MPHTSVNPFATRYVRPGQLSWIGSGTHSLERLAEKFTNQLSSRGAIIGPHGSGKSTLLAHLVPLLGRVVHHEPATSSPEPGTAAKRACDLSDDHARPISWLCLRRKQAPAKRVWLSRKHWSRGGLLVIDGFEQLPFAMQYFTIVHTRIRHMGILVTAHGTLPLKILLRTEASVTLAQQVITQTFQNLGKSAPPELLSEEFLQPLLQIEHGNLREVLMRLYDISATDLPS